MTNSRYQKILSWSLILFIGAFLIVPILNSFLNAFIDQSTGSLTISNFIDVFARTQIGPVFWNSIVVSLAAALLAVLLAFIVAYTVNYTNVQPGLKRLLSVLVMIPMLLPTITYGFAIIYAMGKQGLFTKLTSLPTVDFYGFGGLMLGYVLYILPIAFLMINNSMKYIDKKYMLISKLLGDNHWQMFVTTILRPLVPALVAAFIQGFFMAFTDYGVPSYIGGSYQVIASVLYNEMLGSLPNFGNGAVIAILMLLPSVVSIIVLNLVNRNAVAFDNVSAAGLSHSKGRDILFGLLSGLIALVVVMIFMPIFIVPFTQTWPYNLAFTLEHLQSAFSDNAIIRAYRNSLTVSAIVAVVGTLLAYLTAIMTERSKVGKGTKGILNSFSIISNTIPGMVLGLAYLLLFNGTSMKNTFLIIIIANILHYYSTPYLTMKNTLSQLSSSWEPTAALLGDSFFQTVTRIITPNVRSALFEVMSYYFINSMVTISAVIFLISTKTTLITTKIQQLQYYNNYNEVFILSIMLFLTNVLVRTVFNLLAEKTKLN